MGKRTKIWLITATFLVALGLIIFASAMTVHDWDFTQLNTAKYETNTYSLSDEFADISIKTETADIVFLPADNGKCKVVCYEPQNAKHFVGVQDSSLIIQEVDEREWYEYIGITLGTPKITVYLPDDEYGMLFIREDTGDIEIPPNFRFADIDILTSTGDVKNEASASETIKIKTSTGDIRVQTISADTLDFSVSTGKVIAHSITCTGDVRITVSTGDTKLNDITCKRVLSTGSTGKISLANVIAEEQISIERNTGDINFEGCDAAEITIKTSTGDVSGSLLSEKIFIVETETGNVNVPRTVTGGKCEITTDTGNIYIKIQN
ncbi:MAG: DUF4097 family beta strand repeat protein [Clostridia bacterium]|nr:DUF4097 family beta strand repeat protein [Clostridia bacterium]